MVRAELVIAGRFRRCASPCAASAAVRQVSIPPALGHGACTPASSRTTHLLQRYKTLNRLVSSNLFSRFSLVMQERAPLHFKGREVSEQGFVDHGPTSQSNGHVGQRIPAEAR